MNGPWPAGGGELGALIRAFDWESTGLGPLADWPRSLKTATDIVLRSPVPLVMLWGEEGIMIYNDAYSGFAGARHPQLLGSRVREGWAEIADFNDNVMRVGLAGGTLAYRDQELTLHRHGKPEQVWMNLDYSPVLDESGRPAGVLAIVLDTTERVRAERALRAERDRSQDILDSMGESFVLLDRDFRVLRMNAEAARFDGRAADEIIGRTCWEAWSGTEHSELGATYRRAMRDRVSIVLEHRVRWGDGREGWIDVRAYPSDDGLALFYRDVTDRVRMAEALRASEGQFRAVAQALPNPVWTASADRRIDWCNDWAYDYTGARLGTLNGDGWTGVVHPDDVWTATGGWQAAAQTGSTYETEFRLRRADGAYRWHIARAVPIRDGDAVVRWVGTNTDIEDRKTAADALSALNVSLEQRVAERTADRDRMWRLSTDIMLVADFAANIVAVNPAWTLLLGWSETDLIGCSFMDLVHPDDRDATLREVGRLSDGATTFRFENRYRKKDGSHLLLSWTAVPDVGFIHAVGRDVTAEREAAEALRQSEAALSHAQKMEAVGQLTGGVAHDFNNLLTVIRSSVDLLKRPNLTEERRQRYVDAISDTTTRAAKLTGQLLAFARRQALKPEVFDVVESVKAISDMVASLTGSRIRIETQVPDTPSYIIADPSQFDTALVNLAVNARDAMNGEGRLTVALRSAATIPARRLHRAKEGDFIAVSVTDTGSGIASDRIDRIFEPFFTTKEVGKGTGLGLSQVIGFVKQSGGDVVVESEAGVGSTFTLYLPRSEDPPDETTLIAASERLVDGHGTRVLIVEDNDAVGAFAAQALGELGYVPVLVPNAAAALAQLAKDPPPFHIVFSDVIMPGMNGIELGQEIRRRRLDIPVVLTSGYSHVLAQNGTDGFELLHKPYSIEELSRVLHKAALWRKRKAPAGAGVVALPPRGPAGPGRP